MAVDSFLKLDGIKGESQDHKHKDEIDVLAWSWGIRQEGSFHYRGGGGSGKADFQDLSFTKEIDKSSPILMLHCATGKHIKEGTLVLRKAGGKELEYLKVKMEDIIVSNVTTAGSDDGSRLPTESISLNFAKITIDYQQQGKDGGAQGGPVNFNYDIRGNVK